LTWAKRAEEAGLVEVTKNLKMAGHLSEDVTRQLKEALNNLKE